MSQPAEWPFKTRIPGRKSFPTSTEFRTQIRRDPDTIRNGRELFVQARLKFLENLLLEAQADPDGIWENLEHRAAEKTRYPWLQERFSALTANQGTAGPAGPVGSGQPA